MASSTSTRSSMSVKADASLRDASEALCSVQLPFDSWVTLEFDMSEEQRGVAIAARIVVERDDVDEDEGDEEESIHQIPVEDALALLAPPCWACHAA